MTVEQLLCDWLTSHNAIGLRDEDGECFCTLDNLCPCMDDPDDIKGSCIPIRAKDCAGCTKHECCEQERLGDEVCWEDIDADIK